MDPAHWTVADLLLAGGDQRQVLDPATGLSKYRTTTAPRAGIPLGSCTASWPSAMAAHAAEVALESWKEHRDPVQGVDASASEVRTRLRRLMGLGSEPGLLLAPSGTDIIYAVSALALRRSGRERVHHVVVGASELGGGTLSAARGLTFSPRTPHAGEVEVGAPVPGLADRCSAEPYYLRQDAGGRIDLDTVDTEIAERVRAAAVEGAAVVLHLVVHSKTGLRAPSVGVVRALDEELGDQLLVLVDAAQGRVGMRDVRRALGFGFPVLWTGSKFYSGPPFSAALVLPPAMAGDPGVLPGGLGQWLSRADLPYAWDTAREALPVAINPGLVLRWLMALEETEAYHTVPPPRRARVYHTFAGAVIEGLGPSPRLHLDLPEPPVHLLASGLGAFPTVFCFSVEGRGGRLGIPALKRLYALLDTDLSSEDPRLGTRFHLGQPVPLGPPDGEQNGVLRVALGARLVTQLHRSSDAGAAWFRARMVELREKTELLVQSGRVE